jgi:hypothetical protein
MQNGNRLLSGRTRSKLNGFAAEHGSTNAALCRRITTVRLVFDRCRSGDAGVFRESSNNVRFLLVTSTRRRNTLVKSFSWKSVAFVLRVR